MESCGWGDGLWTQVWTRGDRPELSEAQEVGRRLGQEGMPTPSFT